MRMVQFLTCDSGTVVIAGQHNSGEPKRYAFSNGQLLDSLNCLVQEATEHVAFGYAVLKPDEVRELGNGKIPLRFREEDET